MLKLRFRTDCRTWNRRAIEPHNFYKKAFQHFDLLVMEWTLGFEVVLLEICSWVLL